MYHRSVMESVDPSSSALAFLRLTGHPLRWAILAELGRSDREVRELSSALNQQQSLVSYHLGRLSAGGLVSTRRSSADRRDAYYRIELERCRELLAGVGGALHPALAAPPGGGYDRLVARAQPARVLFLCTGNSSRSQLAEAFTRQLAGDWLAAVSAGSSPKAIHPNAVRVASGYGLDLSGARSKHFDEFVDRSFDHVVTLCDRVREVCPPFLHSTERIHWSIPDPAIDEDGYPAFQRVAADIRQRIEFFLPQVRQCLETGGSR